jgi:hypothetical protein
MDVDPSEDTQHELHDRPIEHNEAEGQYLKPYGKNGTLDLTGDFIEARVHKVVEIYTFRKEKNADHNDGGSYERHPNQVDVVYGGFA